MAREAADAPGGADDAADEPRESFAGNLLNAFTAQDFTANPLRNLFQGDEAKQDVPQQETAPPSQTLHAEVDTVGPIVGERAATNRGGQRGRSVRASVLAIKRAQDRLNSSRGSQEGNSGGRSARWRLSTFPGRGGGGAQRRGSGDTLAAAQDMPTPDERRSADDFSNILAGIDSTSDEQLQATKNGAGTEKVTHTDEDLLVTAHEEIAAEEGEPPGSAEEPAFEGPEVDRDGGALAANVAVEELLAPPSAEAVSDGDGDAQQEIQEEQDRNGDAQQEIQEEQGGGNAETKGDDESDDREPSRVSFKDLRNAFLVEGRLDSTEMETEIEAEMENSSDSGNSAEPESESVTFTGIDPVRVDPTQRPSVFDALQPHGRPARGNFAVSKKIPVRNNDARYKVVVDARLAEKKRRNDQHPAYLAASAAGGYMKQNMQHPCCPNSVRQFFGAKVDEEGIEMQEIVEEGGGDDDDYGFEPRFSMFSGGGEEIGPNKDTDAGFWPEEILGMHPVVATKMVRIRDWRHELLAAISGRDNLQGSDEAGDFDPDYLDIVPDPTKTEAGMELFSRDHPYGHAPDEATRSMERAAFLVLEDIRNRVDREMLMVGGYKKLFLYGVAIFLLFAVATLQWGLGSINFRMRDGLTNQLFSIDTNSLDTNQEIQTSGFAKSDMTYVYISMSYPLYSTYSSDDAFSACSLTANGLRQTCSTTSSLKIRAAMTCAAILTNTRTFGGATKCVNFPGVRLTAEVRRPSR